MTTPRIVRIYGAHPRSIALSKRKIGKSQWEISLNGRGIAVAAKTGSHLDDYPWSWHGPSVGTGTTETLAAAIDEIGVCLLTDGAQ